MESRQGGITLGRATGQELSQSLPPYPACSQPLKSMSAASPELRFMGNNSSSSFRDTDVEPVRPYTGYPVMDSAYHMRLRDATAPRYWRGGSGTEPKEVTAPTTEANWRTEATCFPDSATHASAIASASTVAPPTPAPAETSCRGRQSEASGAIKLESSPRYHPPPPISPAAPLGSSKRRIRPRPRQAPIDDHENSSNGINEDHCWGDGGGRTGGEVEVGGTRSNHGAEGKEHRHWWAGDDSTYGNSDESDRGYGCETAGEDQIDGRVL